jgi:Tfp pilus assembly ATPase PilU
MDLDEVPEAEVAVAVAVTAVLASPKVRRFIRRGAVYGLAALLASGSGMAEATQSLSRSFRSGTPRLEHGLQDITWPAASDQAGEVNPDA